MAYKLLKITLILTLIGALIAITAIAGAYWYVKSDLPPTESLREIELQVPLRVYSRDGKFIAQFGEKKRIPVALKDTPKQLIGAFLAAEDDKFFQHPGIDLFGLARAAINLAITGERRQGGSTITMQVARNFFLTRERTYLRKIKEIFLSIQIERELSKEEILELYLNKIYLGHRAYGIGAATQVYYGKTLDELSLAETAMIAGLPKAPSTTNPLTNPEQARNRRNYVLRRMLETDHISDSEYQVAITMPVTARRHRENVELEAPYLAEMVRSFMIDLYGNEAYTAGYVVHTTVDSELQSAADKALRNALDSYDRRHGWRGPETRFDSNALSHEDHDQLLRDYSTVGELRPAVVLETNEQQTRLHVQEIGELLLEWPALKWARPYLKTNSRGPAPKTAAEVVAPGDLVRVQQYLDEEENLHWRLAQIPAVSGALVSLNPSNGALLALSGGYDYYNSKFNRATQAERQPGSGFKAFIYSAALESGYTAASLINDAPVVFNDVSLEDSWRPQNYSGKFFGLTRLRQALTKSRNLVSIRLLRNIGIQYALDYASRFGFDPSSLPANLTLALGSGVVTPWDMARGYAVLANGGYLIEPYFIERIDQPLEGEVYKANPATVCNSCDTQLQQFQQQCPECNPDEFVPLGDDGQELSNLAPRVITPENRFLMYSMMQDVVQHGTARKAKQLNRQDIAGKTGTSNDQRDAWFNGFNQSVVTNVWVGFDDNSKLGKGEVGGRAALPAWIEYMRAALEGTPEALPEVPVDLVHLKIDPKTGLRAAAGQPDAVFEYFRSEYVPTASAETPPETIETPQGEPAASEEIDELF